MSKKKQKKDFLESLLDLIIVVMIFVIIAVSIKLAFYMKVAGDFSSHTQDANKLSFELGRNDYASLIQGKYMNTINNKNKTEKYHALADYTEAASLYKVYAAKGRTEEAKEQAAVMNSSRKEMGALTVYADKVDVMFGVK